MGLGLLHFCIDYLSTTDFQIFQQKVSNASRATSGNQAPSFESVLKECVTFGFSCLELWIPGAVSREIHSFMLSLRAITFIWYKCESMPESLYLQIGQTHEYIYWRTDDCLTCTRWKNREEGHVFKCLINDTTGQLLRAC